MTAATAGVRGAMVRLYASRGAGSPGRCDRRPLHLSVLVRRPADEVPHVNALGLTIYVVVLMLVYVMLALGLNIVVGFAGLLDLGYVAFFALGAYAVGWFASDRFTASTSTSARRRRARASRDPHQLLDRPSRSPAASRRSRA